MISIVMAYLDRKALLDKTMESIDKSVVKDYELIIVDDGSKESLVCDRAKVIRIETANKWYYNPCVPFNIGFKEVKGDIVVIQNPECYHVGDILKYVEDNIKSDVYLSFGCYAPTKEQTLNFHETGNLVIENHTADKIGHGWYNHSVYLPVGYHFCSAIMRKDLEGIGGFDEQYALGISYDDDDFIRKLTRRDFDIKIIDNPYVIHQHHSRMAYAYPNMKQLHERNKKIFTNG